MTNINTSYVKFIRGSHAAYNALPTKDADTLYFISEVDATVGTLYLGSKVIASGELSQVITLDALEDVVISAGLSDQSMLVYDASLEKWVNRPIADFVAQVQVDNKTIVFDSNVLSLKDFGEKFYKFDDEFNTYNLQIVDDNNPFSEGLEPRVVAEDGQLVLGWFEPNPTTIDGVAGDLALLQTQVNNLDTVVSNLYTNDEIDSAIATAVASADHLQRKVVASKDEIDASAVGADKFIYMVPNGDHYDEYMVINGVIDLIGNTAIDLSNYATVDQLNEKVDKVDGMGLSSNDFTDEDVAALASLQTTVANLNILITGGTEDTTDGLQGDVINLQTIVSNLGDTIGDLNSLTTENNNTVVAAINELDSRLKWEELK